MRTRYISTLLVLFLLSTGNLLLNGIDMNTPKPNKLIEESSPYLLQHAHNPVNWYPWGEEAFKKAEEEDKPIIISIGYSSCHWCHVMEEESFEDEEVARLMNERFISIKVDREERPDIDSLYMGAVQLITGRGGWPLNAFALPDGRPFYGGTYFPKKDWIIVLTYLADLYENMKSQAVGNAEIIEKEIQDSSLQLLDTRKIELSVNDLNTAVSKMKDTFDTVNGGINGAPKFPMPSLYHFLLSYAYLQDDAEIKDFTTLTLDKMAYGGIYDQIGGGFARYSTDEAWKVPHFEKMLYDNAQLVSLYADAYRYTKSELYRDVVYDTLRFVKESFTSPEGVFYSALDADSEGEEGKYYVWTEKELKQILGDDYPTARDYYGIGTEGFWDEITRLGSSFATTEEGNNILLRPNSSLESDFPKETLERIRTRLKKERDKRIPPGLDDKSLTSWNALMISAYTDAYKAFGENDFLTAAKTSTDHILKKVRQPDGGLYHVYKEGRSYIEGFLDDYALMISALISLFEITGDTALLDEAEYFTAYVIENFYESEENLFYFTSNTRDTLIVRTIEVTDTIIPSSNSVLAQELFRLSRLTGKTDYYELSVRMLERISSRTIAGPEFFSHWAERILYELNPYYEVVVAGRNADQISQELQEFYLPNTVFAATTIPNDQLGLFAYRYSEDETRIFICENSTCQFPVTTIKEALNQLQ
jgi:uncharacterized protein